jgi:hypothetical protein
MIISIAPTLSRKRMAEAARDDKAFAWADGATVQAKRCLARRCAIESKHWQSAER